MNKSCILAKRGVRVLVFSIAGAMLLVVCVGLLGCAANPQSMVTITLDSNTGTGYKWVNSSSEQSVLKQVSIEEKAQDDRAGGNLKTTFIFKAEQAGKTSLSFSLVRSWEDEEPAKHAVYEFDVNDKLNVTFVGSQDSDSQFADPILSER